MIYDTKYFDCNKCHGNGCDICGGTGKSNEAVELTNITTEMMNSIMKPLDDQYNKFLEELLTEKCGYGTLKFNESLCLIEQSNFTMNHENTIYYDGVAIGKVVFDTDINSFRSTVTLIKY